MISEQLADLKRRMEKGIESFHHNLGGLRTGRASASLLEPIRVDAYGSKMPINQVATVSVPEARMLMVHVWDNGLVKPVEKAIRESGLDLNPQTEGQYIRVPLPELSEENRRKLAGMAAKFAEDARIVMRNIRRDGMDALKKIEKDGHISEDELHQRSDEVEKLTKDFVHKVDEALKVKEQEIMKV